MGATVAPTALREPRAHSSTVRTFGWGRARHSSARTLTTDRAPLSLPPRTSVESDPRLNKLDKTIQVGVRVIPTWGSVIGLCTPG